MRRVVARDRRTQGRADGYLFLALRWPSGDFRQRSTYCRRLDPMLRLFRDRLRMVPPEELPDAKADLYATVRKASGGLRRVTLARWSGTESLEAFFASARSAWLEIPKEDDDQGRELPVDGAKL